MAERIERQQLIGSIRIKNTNSNENKKVMKLIPSRHRKPRDSILDFQKEPKKQASKELLVNNINTNDSTTFSELLDLTKMIKL